MTIAESVFAPSEILVRRHFSRSHKGAQDGDGKKVTCSLAEVSLISTTFRADSQKSKMEPSITESGKWKIFWEAMQKFGSKVDTAPHSSCKRQNN